MIGAGCLGNNGGNSVSQPTTTGTTFSPDAPVAGQTVSFTVPSSDGGGDSNANFTWWFGDGTNATGLNVSHVYQLPGLYEVELSVQNSAGTATNVQNLIFIQVSPLIPTMTATTKAKDLNPVPSITLTPEVGTPNTSVQANATGSYGWTLNTAFSPTASVSGDNLPLAKGTTNLTKYSWNWGDGSAASTGIVANHTYTKAGIYAVNLTVTADTGKTASALETVIIIPTPPTVSGASDPNVFVTATISGPQSFDPGFDYETAGGTVIEQTYDRLYTYDHGDTKSVIGVIAASLPTIASNNTYATIQIRQGLTFQDGTPINASAVAFSLNRLILMNDPASAASAVLAPIVRGAAAYETTTGTAADRTTFLKAGGIEVVNQYEIALAMPPGASDVAARLAFSACSIVNPVIVKASHQERVPLWGSATTTNTGSYMTDGLPPATVGGKIITRDPYMDTHTAGSGPFSLREWLPNDRAIMDAWPGYYGPTIGLHKAIVKTVIIRYVDDLNTRVLMFKNGEADDIYVPVSQIGLIQPQIQSIAHISFQDTLTTAAGFFNYNQASDAQHPCPTVDGVAKCQFFANNSTRQAVVYAFDYNSFINNVGKGHLNPLGGPIPYGLSGANPNLSYKQNVTRAKAAWAAAGLTGHKVVFNVYYNSGNLVRQGAANILATSVEALDTSGNIQVNVVSEPFASILDHSQKQLLSFWFLGWAPDYIGTYDYIQPFLQTGGNYPVDQAFSDPQFDTAISKAVNITDPTQQAAAWSAINSLAVQKYVDLWLYQGQQVHVERSYVSGYYFSPLHSGQPDVGDYSVISKS
ncbi:MAG: ABC transporter substrate-binding protein [Thermoplasmatota archaeon]